MPVHDPEDWHDYLANEAIGDLPPFHLGMLDGLMAARQASADDEQPVRPLSDRRALDEAALASVLDEAERARGSRPSMEVVCDRGLRIASLRPQCIAGEPTRGPDALIPAEALVELADAVFDASPIPTGRPRSSARSTGSVSLRSWTPGGRSSGVSRRTTLRRTSGASAPGRDERPLPAAHAVPATVAARPGDVK